MHWPYTPYVLPLLIAAAVSAVFALYAWRRRPAPGAAPFALLMLAVAEWSLGYALELGSADLPSQVFWAKVQYLGIVSVSVTWLAFALQYTGREKWLTRRNVALLAIVPLLTLLLVWTNDLHGLIWSNIGQDTSGPFLVLDLTYGAWFWVNWVYSYLLLLLGTLLFIQTLIRRPHLYRGQASALLLGALAPWVGNALYVSGLSPFPHLDLTPFAFTLTGLAAVWGLFRFRLLDIVPVARDAVIGGMSDGVIVLDVQNRIVDLNPAAQRIIGRPGAEAIGQPAAQVLSGWPDGSTEPVLRPIPSQCGRVDSTREIGAEGLAELLVERYHDVTEAHAEIVLGEGEAQRCFDLRISPLYDWRGRLTGRLVVLRDITERKWAEEALHHRVEEMAALQATVLDITAPYDLPTLLHTIVERAARLLDAPGGGLYLCDPERREVRCVVSYNTPRDFTGTVLKYGEGAAGTVAQTGEPLIIDDYRTWAGRAAVYEEEQPFTAVLSAPMMWQDQMTGVIHVLHDVETQRFTQPDLELLTLFANHAAIAVENAQLLEQVQRHAAELEQRVAKRTQELRDAQEELVRKEKLATLGQLAGGVGHDLRNPLGAISNAAYYLDMVLEEPDPDVKEMLDIIAKEVRTSEGIISSLLDFARSRPPILHIVDLNDVVQEALSRTAVPENVEVVRQLDETLPTVMADPDQLGQVFGNIILNAVQAMTLPSRLGTPEGGRLVIKTSEVSEKPPKSGWVAVSITDTGVGIPEENLGKLFEPLFTTRAKGIGLGLALVKTLVEGHGGSIEVESPSTGLRTGEVGEGSTFTVRLPVGGVISGQ